MVIHQLYIDLVFVIVNVFVTAKLLARPKINFYYSEDLLVFVIVIVGTFTAV